MKDLGKNRVLITGAAGFLGSHLCKRYLEAGWEVLAVDNFQTGRKQNIAPFLGNPKFELHTHDIVEPLYLEADLILNFACPASPPRYQEDPIKTFKTSVIGTMNLLGMAKRVGARFVQASTSEIYGDPEQHPQPESYWGNVNTTGIRSCYDEGKRAAETLVADYQRVHGVDTRMVRIFNTYGPNMDPEDGRVISNFIVQSLKGEPITIYGDGKQSRSFCYCDDLVDGIISFTHQDAHNGPVNIGNNCEFNIIELANQVLELTGSTSKLVYKDLPSDDPKVRKPDIRLAEELFDYAPKYSLVEGLKKTIPYFRTQI